MEVILSVLLAFVAALLVANVFGQATDRLISYAEQAKDEQK